MDIRPATARDLDTLLDFPVDPRVGFVGPDRFRAELDAGRMRWPWSWLALDDGAVVGRALWWGRADSNAPLALDCLHVLERCRTAPGSPPTCSTVPTGPSPRSPRQNPSRT
ncbi:MAG: hypothetical protein ACRYF3_13460 [Janthinobacterium lividum]